jgi:hypothetical protein
MLRQLTLTRRATIEQMDEVGKDRSVRRARLAEEISRKRFSLNALKLTERKVPSSVSAVHAAAIQKVAEGLEKLEEEFHELNVQQIREELGKG